MNAVEKMVENVDNKQVGRLVLAIYLQLEVFCLKI